MDLYEAVNPHHRFMLVKFKIDDIGAQRLRWAPFFCLLSSVAIANGALKNLHEECYEFARSYRLPINKIDIAWHGACEYLYISAINPLRINIRR